MDLRKAATAFWFAINYVLILIPEQGLVHYEFYFMDETSDRNAVINFARSNGAACELIDMDPRSFHWVPPYPQSSELIREHQRPTVLQRTQLDHFEPTSSSNFFSPLNIASGFPFPELDYRIHDSSPMIQPSTAAEQTIVPTTMETGDLQKDIPELKPFTLHTPRSVPDHEFPLFNPVFQYPVPGVDAGQFSIKKDVKDEFNAYLTQPSQNYSSNPPSVQMHQTFTFTKPNDNSCNITQDCQVCHSTHANGLHFGARTCAACAAFFRRTISDGKKYVCKRSQRCNNPSRDATGYRKICRSCRLKRCMDIGMLPDNVQHKRSRRESPPPPITKSFSAIFQPFYDHMHTNGGSTIASSL
ncbi:hypothetical protein Y032_0563g3518 [Ancylostoma ceylanicum]|nr:hypothetical protein Y032_0563g3518 [Ancylostoma ceylanicum]